jgi:hypothetical protein
MHVLKSVTPVLRWHFRHVLVIWLGLHVVLAMVLLLSGALPGASRTSLREIAVGGAATTVALGATVVLTALDRRRIGAPLLFANMGYSPVWLMLSSAAVAMLAETLLHAAAFAMMRATV